MPIRSGWCPPRSPHSLIQEDLFPNEFLILVSCVLLNCTARKQVEGVMPAFVGLWPTAQHVVAADVGDISATISRLGFGNRRALALKKLARDYLSPGWSDARQLYGIGEYAGRAWDIFCQGEVGDEPPRDHALVRYWQWLVSSKKFALVNVSPDSCAVYMGQDEQRQAPHR